MTGRLIRVSVLAASCAFAAVAQASYGQMRLDGIGFLLAFASLIACGVIVDVALIAKVFRYRTALVIELVVALALILFFVGQAVIPSERAGFFKGAPGGAPLVVLLLTSAVFLPFIVVAPFAQYRALQEGRRSPGWITAWMGLQLALLPGFLVLAWTEQLYWQREHAAGVTVGREVQAGEFGAVLDRAARQRERIWGTGWTTPWASEPHTAYYLPRRSGWIAGLASGVDASAPILANEPLSDPDRKALQALIERHFAGYALPNVKAKLVWDVLEPGAFSRQLAPAGVEDVGAVDEEVLTRLLERLERDGDARLCPGGRMLDADRAVLIELVTAKARFYEAARQRERDAALDAKQLEVEMSEAPAPYRLTWKAPSALGDKYGGQSVGVPDWSRYPEQVERLCRGPG